MAYIKKLYLAGLSDFRSNFSFKRVLGHRQLPVVGVPRGLQLQISAQGCSYLLVDPVVQQMANSSNTLMSFFRPITTSCHSRSALAFLPYFQQRERVLFELVLLGDDGPSDEVRDNGRSRTRVTEREVDGMNVKRTFAVSQGGDGRKGK